MCKEKSYISTKRVLACQQEDETKKTTKQLSDVLSVTLGLCVTDSGLALLRLVFNIDYHIMLTQYVLFPAGSPSQ